MDIGSIFPLYYNDMKVASQDDVIETPLGGKMLFSLCREALFLMASRLETSNKTVLLPAYTCDTVITPFKELGWKCIYYPVDLQLRIDTQAAMTLFDQSHASLIVVHPYYGKDLNDVEVAFLELIHEKGCKIAVDLTQCIFSSQRLQCVDFYLGSIRKWYAIPDGGYLESTNDAASFDADLKENSEYVSLQRDAMYLRGLYFRTGDEEVKNISRRINKMADRMVDVGIRPHKMSSFSCRLLIKESVKDNQKARFDNYKFLLDNIKVKDGWKILCDNLSEVTTAPLYFMFYVENRGELQRKLSEQHIYTPILWPVVYEEVLVNDTVKYIYDHILAIPIDQRYEENDMKKVVDLLNNQILQQC